MVGVKLLVGRDNWRETKMKTTATLQQTVYGTQELNRLEGHSQKVNAVSVSKDGELLATASDDGTTKVWQQNGTLLQTLTGKKAQQDPLIIALNNNQREIPNPNASKNSSKNSAYLVSTKDDGIVQRRSLSNNQLVNSYSHSEPVNDVSVSPDKQLLATATMNGKVNIWSKDGILLQTLTGHTGEVLDVEFLGDRSNSNSVNSSGDRYKLVSTGVDKTVRVWQVFNRYSDRVGVYSVAVSPTSNNYAVADWDNKIEIWRNNLDGRQKLIRTIPGHEDTISQIKYSPDGNLIASASWDKTIKLWDAKTGDLINTLRQEDGINSIAFSPDGRTLISAGEAKTIKIWNLTNTPKLSKTLKGHTDSIKTVAVSPDGALIASAGYDNTVKLWNGAGELLQTIDAHNLAITSLAFTPDSETLASASWDNTVKLWSIQDAGKSSKLIRTLTGHQDGVTTIDFNSDGILATGSGDRNIKLWDTHTGELIKKPARTYQSN